MKEGKCYPQLVKTKYVDFIKEIGFEKIDLCGCIIAGGAVRETLSGKTPNDIDIFGTAENCDRFMFVNSSKILSNKKSPIGHRNIELLFCDIPVQLIRTEAAVSVLELLADFDIRMCRFAYMDEMLCYDSGALLDVANKKLVISSFHTPYLTLTRLPKYTARGYGLEPTPYKALLEVFYSMSTEELMREKELIANCQYDGAF